jgi:hypothetical protein
MQTLSARDAMKPKCRMDWRNSQWWVVFEADGVEVISMSLDDFAALRPVAFLIKEAIQDYRDRNWTAEDGLERGQ